MVIKKIKNRILDESDMHNFYKEEYTKNSDEINDLKTRIIALENENNKQNKILNSYHSLLNSIFCYYDITPKRYLRNIQELGVEILNFISNVCEKYELEYWLDYGTLLGAIRHDGYIPWDDDVDIGMMRADYSKFIKVIRSEVEKKNLNNLKCNFQKYKFKGETVKRWTQIVYKHPNYDVTFMGTDVFPYDYIIPHDFSNIDDAFLESRSEFYINNNKKIPFNQVLDKYYDKLNLSLEKQEFFISGVEGVRSPDYSYKIAILNTDKLFPLKNANFNGFTFKIPNNCDYYLKKIYGKSYCEIPKVIKDHGRVSKLLKIENITEILEDAIDEIKTANEKF